MSLKIRIAAQCEAAGRPNNEDNFQLNDNLSNAQWGFTTDKIVVLDRKGALLVVCDGMGGMNAGEVASATAIQTIKNWFAPDNITNQILESHDSVMRHIEKSIVAADAQIKEAGKKDKEKEGMGSTIVMAWIVDKYVYVGWCGDSRAYRFNPKFGLEQLSHDHSYVQELVDAGKLSQELAFDHPSNNIITRSLGDSRQKAKPEVKRFPLYDGDIILLCSDGLSGVLRDNEIKAILEQQTNSMESCRDALWNESKKIGWHDNVTLVLCQVIDGGEKPMKNYAKNNESNENNGNNEQRKKKPLTLTALIFMLVFLVIGMIGGYFLGKYGSTIFDFTRTEQRTYEKQDDNICVSVLPTDSTQHIDSVLGKILNEILKKGSLKDSLLKYDDSLETNITKIRDANAIYEDNHIIIDKDSIYIKIPVYKKTLPIVTEEKKPEEATATADSTKNTREGKQDTIGRDGTGTGTGTGTGERDKVLIDSNLTLSEKYTCEYCDGSNEYYLCISFRKGSNNSIDTIWENIKNYHQRIVVHPITKKRYTLMLQRDEVTEGDIKDDEKKPGMSKLRILYKEQGQ
jgi:serine/threonine protein phosphatase PrpC